MATQYLFYKKSYTNYTDYYTNTSGAFQYESADVDIRNDGYSILIGKNKYFTKNWLVDVYFGLGKRFTTTTYSTITNTTPNTDRMLNEWQWLDDDRNAGKERVAYLALGLKVAYVLKRTVRDHQL